MTPEKYEALRLQVKDLVHAEMHLLEGFFTKRVMLMLEYADSIGEPARAVPTAALNGDLVESATLAMDAYMDRNPNAAHEDYVRAALEAVWPKQPQCERRLAAVARWLEANQPDVFSRGLWDAINEA